MKHLQYQPRLILFVCLAFHNFFYISLKNGHLREPVTLTLVPERLAVEVSLHVLTNLVCRGWDSNTQPSTCGAIALIDCVIAATSGCGRLKVDGSKSEHGRH